MPSRGLGVMLLSCAACQAGGGRVSLLLRSRLGGEHLLTGQGLRQQFVPQGCRARSRHQREWPDLPLQHQQPTQNTQGNGLAARQGRAPSPVTDRRTDRQISVGSGLALPVPRSPVPGSSPARLSEPARVEPSRFCLALAPGAPLGARGRPGPGTRAEGAPRPAGSADPRTPPATPRAAMPGPGLRGGSRAGRRARLHPSFLC